MLTSAARVVVCSAAALFTLQWPSPPHTPQTAAGPHSPLQDAAGALNPAKRQKQAPQPPQWQQQQQHSQPQHTPKQQQQQPKAQQQPAKLKSAGKPAAPTGRARDNSTSGGGGGADGIAGSKKTMFYDLLAQQGVLAPIKGATAAAAPASSLQAAFLQDLRTERELARKLKVKKVGVACTAILRLCFVAACGVLCVSASHI